MEYRYAVESGKPVIAFLHGDPDALPARSVERTKQNKMKLRAFRDLVRQKMCKEWTTPHELGSVVARSLVTLKKRHAAVGWIRADQVPEQAATEMLELRKKVDRLERALQEARTQAPPGTDDLARGNEELEVTCEARFYEKDYRSRVVPYSATLTWNTILYTTLPVMMNEIEESGVNGVLAKRVIPEVPDAVGLKLADANGVAVEADCFRTVIVQLHALGLIKRGRRPRSVRDRSAYWLLTPYGESVMTRLRAVTKASTGSAAASER